ncbi:hypothetical protein NECAME_14546 [Necator americanus]|uniref:Inositol polyphosphate-related phosphatase domain-containing protein n=1 Tax=Necator americanus TaxID=51031 RepID=W2SMN8_NECAM|nr:hypothetical protein NECAME_14546 [Necator americanus]ETN70758.1 hypothetical protein NECAME_14546 [Necator americanus]
MPGQWRRQINFFVISITIYPWSENPDESEVMMKTRPPAWCDRVLMNATAFTVVKKGNPIYSSFGKDVCTGDHKPVALAFSLDV